MQDIMKFISNHFMLSLAWVTILGAVIFTTFHGLFSKIENISHIEAIRLINNENAVIIDLRSRSDYRKGHIINSLNLTTLDIKSGNLGKLDKLKNKPIIIVCANGISSHHAAKHLIKAKYKRVYVLKEGISGWNKENLPLV